MGRFTTGCVAFAAAFPLSIALAQAAQTQSRLVVSARVLVTSTVDAALSNTQALSATASEAERDNQNGASSEDKSASKDAGASDAKAPRCATVAVSCSSRTPMRLSIDGKSQKSDAAAECKAGVSAETNVSLCSESQGAAPVAITIEY